MLFPLKVVIQQNGLADLVNLWNDTLQVESLGENNLEDLLDVDGVGSRAEDLERSVNFPETLRRLC